MARFESEKEYTQLPAYSFYKGQIIRGNDYGL